MGTINRVDTKGFRKDAHLNFMGGPSYDVKNPIFNLKLAASSCFFGEPMYYHRDETRKVTPKHSPEWRLSVRDVEYLAKMLDSIDPSYFRQLSPKEMMEKAIDEAIKYSIEDTLKVASMLRNEDLIRVTPQVILVRAANSIQSKGTGIIKSHARDIIKRADEPATGLAYQLEVYGKPIPNALKKVWAEYLGSLKEFQLAKYRQESREVKLVDVINLVHAHSPAIDKLMRGELKLTDKTWEAIVSEKGSNKIAWEEALEVMGHMALLRNIRNLLKAGVEPKEFTVKLLHGAEFGKQLPFRYYTAYKENSSAPGIVLDTIEECLKISLDNLPRFAGKVMSLVDNSGSARGNTTSEMGTVAISDIGNLSGVLTGMVSDDGYVGVFGDRLETIPVRKGSSIFDTVREVDRIGNSVGGGTENGIWLFWDKAIKNKEHWDTVFVYSDMQAGHGGLYGTNAMAYRDYIWHGAGSIHGYIDVPKLINEYRTRVNPDVNVFLVQIAGYQDTLVPEFYKKTYILGGWSSSVLKFAGEIISLVQ